MPWRYHGHPKLSWTLLLQSINAIITTRDYLSTMQQQRAGKKNVMNYTSDNSVYVTRIPAFFSRDIHIIHYVPHQTSMADMPFCLHSESTELDCNIYIHIYMLSCTELDISDWYYNILWLTCSDHINTKLHSVTHWPITSIGLEINKAWWPLLSWWRHQMETFSVSLALCAGNSLVTGEFPSQGPVSRSYDVFFDLRLNKRLSKQSWGWWFETLSRLLLRHCNYPDNLISFFSHRSSFGDRAPIDENYDHPICKWIDMVSA